MNYAVFAEQAKRKLDILTDAERFRFWVCLSQDAPYTWGGETMLGPDCSGSVALGLFGAGYNVRLTADMYLRLLFTNTPGKTFDPQEIACVFYLADSDRGHGPGSIKKGTASHVTPIVGDDVVLDAAWGKPARLRSIGDAERLHMGFGTTPVHASIDWAALDTLHKSGKYPVDDKELLALMT